MSQFLNEEEHQQLQQQIAEGKTRLTIPRSVARQFFLRVDNKSIKETTNESAMAKKLLIWSGTVSAPILFGVCAILLIIETGMFAALAVPLAGIIWTVLAGFTSETGEWPSITVAVAVTGILYGFSGDPYSLALMIFTLSLWVHRMTFILAQHFLNQLVTSSFAAYDMLVDHVQLENCAD